MRASRESLVVTVFVLVLVFLAFSSGCGHPRFEAKRAIRDARIARYVRACADREAAGPERMRWLVNTDRELQAQRGEHLSKTLALIAEH